MINFNIFIYTYLYLYIVKYIYIGYIYIYISNICIYNIYICIFIHNAIQTLIVPKDRVIKSITGACYRMLVTRQVIHTPLPNGWEIRT